ncbi:hypothetical protein AV274_4550 [Blastocystis sp. ATCC 50177/Nand II]|uniref:Uncharacterized protein n=1 Tax=Blastocystis sp. subtype 1 (strain ATCC 50177 / NandII) TaxID=478820 RepID=A0A196SC95_BLAHN|nr:hypothetical protein AV274_4550 [Blastocystis sp. ATCC 50177/Nand II]
MSFWKPGEAYPDKVAEEEMETEERIPLDNTPAQRASEKVQLSDATKNLPFMIRSDAEKLKKREEIAAMKELKTYMWSYRKLNATEAMEV